MEISLLEKRVKKIRDKQRLKRTVGKILLSIIGGLITIMLILFLLTLRFNLDNKNLNRKIEGVKNKIGSLQPVETKQVYLVSKLKTFEKLLVLQEKHQLIARAVFSLIPDGTTIEGFEINEEGKIKLIGSITDWNKFMWILKNIKQGKTEKMEIKNAVVNKVSFSNKNKIDFDIDIVLAVGKK